VNWGCFFFFFFFEGLVSLFFFFFFFGEVGVFIWFCFFFYFFRWVRSMFRVCLSRGLLWGLWGVLEFGGWGIFLLVLSDGVGLGLCGLGVERGWGFFLVFEGWGSGGFFGVLFLFSVCGVGLVLFSIWGGVGVFFFFLLVFCCGAWLWCVCCFVSFFFFWVCAIAVLLHEPAFPLERDMVFHWLRIESVPRCSAHFFPRCKWGAPWND